MRKCSFFVIFAVFRVGGDYLIISRRYSLNTGADSIIRIKNISLKKECFCITFLLAGIAFALSACGGGGEIDLGGQKFSIGASEPSYGGRLRLSYQF